LGTFEIYKQQILYISSNERAANVNGSAPPTIEKEGKKEKIHLLYLKPAMYMACVLACKACFIGKGIFSMIHEIRRANVTTVLEALDAVEEG
jgi:hypothetical protein